MRNIYSLLKELFVLQSECFTDDDASLVCEYLAMLSGESIFLIIVNNKQQLKEVTTGNIPQFSNLDDIYDVVKILKGIDSNTTYEDIGYYLRPKGASKGALTKYGENHYKIAAQLGLCRDSKYLELTKLGKVFCNTESKVKRDKIIKRLALRVPIIQHMLCDSLDKHVNALDYMNTYLSPSTVMRRSSNVRALLNGIQTIAIDEIMKNAINNILWEKI